MHCRRCCRSRTRAYSVQPEYSSKENASPGMTFSEANGTNVTITSNNYICQLWCLQTTQGSVTTSPVVFGPVGPLGRSSSLGWRGWACWALPGSAGLAGLCRALPGSAGLCRACWALLGSAGLARLFPVPSAGRQLMRSRLNCVPGGGPAVGGGRWFCRGLAPAPAWARSHRTVSGFQGRPGSEPGRKLSPGLCVCPVCRWPRSQSDARGQAQPGGKGPPRAASGPGSATATAGNGF